MGCHRRRLDLSPDGGGEEGAGALIAHDAHRAGSILRLPWPATEATVDCGTGQHRITWAKGRLVCPHHDLAAELTLRALGGEPSECVRLMLAWRDYRVEPHLPRALLTGDPEMLSRQTIPVFGPRPRRPGKDGIFAELRGLLGLERLFRQRLTASSIVAMSRRPVLRRLMPDDRVELQVFARDALRASIASLAPAADVNVDVHLTDEEAPPVLFSRVRDARVVITGRLPLSWLAVFASGLSTCAGVLVAGIDRTGPSLSLTGWPVGVAGELGDRERRCVPVADAVASAAVPALAAAT